MRVKWLKGGETLYVAEKPVSQIFTARFPLPSKVTVLVLAFRFVIYLILSSFQSKNAVALYWEQLSTKRQKKNTEKNCI